MPSPIVEPVGTVELTERCQVTRTTVERWRAKGDFPQPRWQVGGRPAWLWYDVVAWLKKTYRNVPEGYPYEKAV